MEAARWFINKSVNEDCITFNSQVMSYFTSYAPSPPVKKLHNCLTIIISDKLKIRRMKIFAEFPVLNGRGVEKLIQRSKRFPVNKDQWKFRGPTYRGSTRRRSARHSSSCVQTRWRKALARVRLREMERDTPMHTVLREICLYYGNPWHLNIVSILKQLISL